MIKAKIILFAVFLTSITNGVSAHSDSTETQKKIQHQVFINGTFFIKQLVSLSNANITISPYIVGYKCIVNKKHGLRFSIGANFTNVKKTPQSSFVQINKTTTVDYRLGYEYQHHFGKRWAIFAGLDAINGFNNSFSRVNSDFDVVTTTENTWTVGGGPVLGIQLNINKFISVFTECAFYYNMGQTKTKTISNNIPDLNVNKITGTEQKAQFLLPTSIYFTFKF